MRYLSDQEHQAQEDLHTAETLLERALELSPAYLDVREDYARLLVTKRDQLGAYRETAILLAAKPASFEFRLKRGEAAVYLERFDEAVALYEALLKGRTAASGRLNAYGSLMKTLGRREAAERTFRTMPAHQAKQRPRLSWLSDLRSNHLNEDDPSPHMMQHLAAGIPETPQPEMHGLCAGADAGAHERIRRCVRGLRLCRQGLARRRWKTPKARMIPMSFEETHGPHAAHLYRRA